MAKSLRAQMALETLIKEIDAELKSLNNERSAAVRALENITRVRPRNGKSVINVEGLKLIEAARMVLEENNGLPMSTEEVAEALIEAGFITNSGDFKSVVSTMLNRYKDEDDGVKSVGRAMWALS